MKRSEESVRIGDAERDATVELLTRHFADGRLTKLEHEERTAIALTATTQPALDALLADLPDLRPPERAGWSRARRVPWPAFRLLRVALLGALVVFVAAHLVPVIAAVALFFVISRLAFGWHRPWGRSGRYCPRW